jgi:hypothetical protein
MDDAKIFRRRKQKLVSFQKTRGAQEEAEGTENDWLVLETFQAERAKP